MRLGSWVVKKQNLTGRMLGIIRIMMIIKLKGGGMGERMRVRYPRCLHVASCSRIDT